MQQHLFMLRLMATGSASIMAISPVRRRKPGEYLTHNYSLPCQAPRLRFFQTWYCRVYLLITCSFIGCIYSLGPGIFLIFICGLHYSTSRINPVAGCAPRQSETQHERHYIFHLNSIFELQRENTNNNL